MPDSAPPRALPALVGLALLLFALITWQVLADGPLVGVDERLSRAPRAAPPREQRNGDPGLQDAGGGRRG
ncbi:hypothetical protein ACFV1X_22060, partial [Streptomyces coelicoflavus]